MDKKMWFIYTMEYYLAVRKIEIWPFAATWMELESVMLSEISHRERQIPYVFTLMWILRNLTETHGGGEGRKKKKEVRVGESSQSIRDSSKLRTN